MEAPVKTTFQQRLSMHAKAGTFGKPTALFPTGNNYRWQYSGFYNGEKNLGEIGPIKYYLMDYYALRLRSWQAWIENPEAQTIMQKYTNWVIGKGLKLQAEPNKIVIGGKGDFKKFAEETEARWQVYSNSKMADFSENKTLNQLQAEAHKNAINGGDVLVILRYIDDCVKVQLVDGAHIISPIYGSEWFPIATANGNRIVNGIEISPTGQQVAFYVRKPFDSLNPTNSFEYERIPAKGSESNLTMAFLVYGLKYRLDNHRGIPIIAAAMEKLKKIERYEEATLGTAEEQAKVVYQVVHQMGSTGEYPWTGQIATAHDLEARTNDLGSDDMGKQLAKDVQVSTNKQAVNNPVGAEVKPLKSNEAQLYFNDFLTKNIDIICAMVMMPPDVAMSKYNSNYSASRAAIKDWEHVLSVTRVDFATQFNQMIYNFWLHIEILKNNIQAPGYLSAFYKNDRMVLEAYRTARFVGAPVANIDPLKEVQAERAKLGITAAAIPLTTVEAATEILNGGDSDHNMEQYSEELKMAESLGIEIPEPKSTQSVSEKI